jgi:hypothetical protein
MMVVVGSLIAVLLGVAGVLVVGTPVAVDSVDGDGVVPVTVGNGVLVGVTGVLVGVLVVAVGVTGVFVGGALTIVTSTASVTSPVALDRMATNV